jgi:hypothetical protein
LEIEEDQLLGMWENFAASGLVPSQTNPGSKPTEKRVQSNILSLMQYSVTEDAQRFSDWSKLLVSEYHQNKSLFHEENSKQEHLH